MQFAGRSEPIGRLETSTVTLRQPWVEGEAYEVALLTSSGGTITHEMPVAVQTPGASTSFFGLMALLGHLRRRDPRGPRHAVAAVDPAYAAGLAARR